LLNQPLRKYFQLGLDTMTPLLYLIVPDINNPRRYNMSQLFAEVNKAVKAEFTNRTLAEQWMIDEEAEIKAFEAERAEAMMGYNSYQECCEAHAIGAINMDTGEYYR